MSLSIQLRPSYLTPNECARYFADHLLQSSECEDLVSDLISPVHVSSINNIRKSYLIDHESLFLSTVAEIASLCSEQYYEHVAFLISFLEELLNLHNDGNSQNYQHLIEKYLNDFVYADLTDYFLVYPIQLQIQIMDILEKSPIIDIALIKNESESDQSKLELFLQDSARYFYNMRSRHFYRQLFFRLNHQHLSQQSILRALLIGALFLPITCHSGLLNELYSLVTVKPDLLSSSVMEIFYHVLLPTGINQSYSVVRAYMCLLLIARLLNIELFFLQLIQISFLIHLRVPHVRINLRHIIEPLSETKGFPAFLQHQQREIDLLQQNQFDHMNSIEPLFIQVHEYLRRGFSLKQLCRMRIRSIFSQNYRTDILLELENIKQLPSSMVNYLAYDLKLLLNDPEYFYQSTLSVGESVWNSTIPPPPDS